MRSGRITAGLVDNRPLPPLGTSFNFGRATTGTLVGAQASENTSLSNQDFDDTLSSFSLTTIGGYTEMSRQEIERSANGDEMVVMDLASIYSNETQPPGGRRFGRLGPAQGHPERDGHPGGDLHRRQPHRRRAVPEAGGRHPAGEHAAADARLGHRDAPPPVGWFTAALDSQNRPLVNINGGAFNSMGGDSAGAAFGVGGPVGTLMGLPVYIDPTVPTNLGAGTNEDRIIISRFVDNKLFEDTGVVPYRMYEEPGSAAPTFAHRGGGLRGVHRRAVRGGERGHQGHRPGHPDVLMATELRRCTPSLRRLRGPWPRRPGRAGACRDRPGGGRPGIHAGRPADRGRRARRAAADGGDQLPAEGDEPDAPPCVAAGDVIVAPSWLTPAGWPPAAAAPHQRTTRVRGGEPVTYVLLADAKRWVGRSDTDDDAGSPPR